MHFWRFWAEYTGSATRDMVKYSSEAGVPGSNRAENSPFEPGRVMPLREAERIAVIWWCAASPFH
jgi:hypothetical protein